MIPVGLTDAQRAIRLTGIGASEVAAILGENEWSSPLAVYIDKVEPGGLGFTGNFATRRGHALEPFIASEYTRATERACYPLWDSNAEPATVRSLSVPFALASIDRFVPHEAIGWPHARPDGTLAFAEVIERIVEVKAPTMHTRHEWGDSATDFPVRYAIQCTWQMLVTGVRTCDLVALLETEDEPRIYSVPYDADLAGALVEKVEHFWRHHVEARNPPTIDGSPAITDYIKRRFPRDDRPAIGATEEHHAIARLLADVEDKLDGIELLRETYRNQLKGAIGDASGMFGTAPDGTLWRATWKNNAQGNVSWKIAAEQLAARALRGPVSQADFDTIVTAARNPAAPRPFTFKFGIAPKKEAHK